MHGRFPPTFLLLCLNLHNRHELQILLRLEMISFDGGQLLEQAAKDQLVDDICKLLDSIQFHLDGGIFGGKNLSKYCDRLLVSRYTSPTITVSLWCWLSDPRKTRDRANFVVNSFSILLLCSGSLNQGNR